MSATRSPIFFCSSLRASSCSDGRITTVNKSTPGAYLEYNVYFGTRFGSEKDLIHILYISEKVIFIKYL